jgi:Na+/alanine symporter
MIEIEKFHPRGVIMDLADLLILGCALPNIIALYLLRHKIKAEMVGYMGAIGK